MQNIHEGGKCNQGQPKYHKIDSYLILQNDKDLKLVASDETDQRKTISLGKLIYNKKQFSIVSSGTLSFEHLRYVNENIDLSNGILGLSSNEIQGIDIFSKDSLNRLETDESKKSIGLQNLVIRIENFLGVYTFMVLFSVVLFLVSVIGINL